MTEYADYYCQCEACFNEKEETVVQYRPRIEHGKVVMQCPFCKSTTGQTILRG